MTLLKKGTLGQPRGQKVKGSGFRKEWGTKWNDGKDRKFSQGTWWSETVELCEVSTSLHQRNVSLVKMSVCFLSMRRVQLGLFCLYVLAIPSVSLCTEGFCGHCLMAFWLLHFQAEVNVKYLLFSHVFLFFFF